MGAVGSVSSCIRNSCFPIIIRNNLTDLIVHLQSYQELMLSIQGVLNDLGFGTSSENFESALKELGLMLGFLSERPDKEFKKVLTT